MNVIFLTMMLLGFGIAAVRQWAWDPAMGGAGPMESLGAAMIKAAEGSVTLSLATVGVMTLFLGLMKIAEAGGLLTVVARALRPLLIRLFPQVPAEHPAMGAIVLNLSANVLGLGNAATPFGIRAMQELDRLNRIKGCATNAMCMFLAINTSSITVLPTGVVALRAAAGSNDPAGIVGTTLFATFCSTTVAIVVAVLCNRFWPPQTVEAAVGSAAVPSATAADVDIAPSTDAAGLAAEAGGSYPLWVSVAVLLGVVALVPLTVIYGKTIAPWIIPGLAVFFLGFGALRRVKTYEVFVEGARDGFQVAVRIIPYLVAILVAVAMVRASGAMEILVEPLGRLTAPLGLPTEGLTMALLRPLSGSGAFGFLAATINDPAIGPDSYTGYLVSTIQGSTETTFYVLAVYFGAVGVRRLRYALLAGICADMAGVAGAVFICRHLYGG